MSGSMSGSMSGPMGGPTESPRSAARPMVQVESLRKRFGGLSALGDFVLVAGNWDSGWLGNLYEGCAATYVPDLPLYSLNRIAGWFSDSSRSDHWNYWQAGVPAVWLTDTGEYRNPGYHTPDDRPEVIDPVFLRRCTQAVLATMLEWTEVATAAEREGQR